MKNSTGKLIILIIFLLMISLCLWNANERFSRRDTDAGIMYCLSGIAFAVAAVSIYIKLKKAFNSSKESKKEVLLAGRNVFYMFISIIGFFIFAIGLLRFSNYSSKKERAKKEEKDRITLHQKWMNEMTLKLNKLSKNHYIEATYLAKDGTSIQENHLKVIEVNDAQVTLVKFNSKENKIPHFIEKNYINYSSKDTITLPLKNLKQSIFKTPYTEEYIYNHQDSLRNEGLFYFIKDIKYIDGPYISAKHEDNEIREGDGDTIYFDFENLNKKAMLTKIVNVSGNLKWNDTLPIDIYGYDIYYESDLKLTATNLDVEKEDYQFKLYLEDSIKNKHVFLISRRDKKFPDCYYYDIERVLD